VKEHTILNQNEILTAPSRWSEDSLATVRQSLEQQLDRQGNLPIPREDLLGEVILRLWGTDPREIKNPAAYAHTILRNLIRDKIREIERFHELLDTLAREQESRPAPRERPGRFEDGEFLQYLLVHTDLTAVQKQVIRMMYFDGLKLTEVARSLSKNPGTIQRHHNRAIEKLSRHANRLEFEA